MSYSIILAFGLTILLLMKFVFHFHESFAVVASVILGIFLAYDLLWNEILPRLFPNSFMTITIRYIDKPNDEAVK